MVRPWERGNGLKQFKKSLPMFQGIDPDSGLEYAPNTGEDSSWLQLLLLKLGATIGGVEEDEKDWFELRSDIISEEIFENPRFGMCVLLLAYKDVKSNRNSKLIYFSNLGLGSYGRTLKNIRQVIGTQMMRLYLGSMIFDLANRGKNERGGGINCHPSLDSIKGLAGDAVKNEMLDSYEARADRWLDAMTEHGVMLKAKKNARAKKKHDNRSRVQRGERPKVRTLNIDIHFPT